MSTNSFLRLLRYFHYFLGTSLIFITAAILASNYIVTIFRVDGHSMDPTLYDQQVLPVCLVCVRQADPKLNDIVIVEYEGASSIRFVKRVLGVPGDRVPYQGITVTLEHDQFFVVGDNRDHSTDSREYGPIKRSSIKGLVLGTFQAGPGPVQETVLQ